MKTKICTKCQLEQSLTQFIKGNDKNGLSYYCKNCLKKYRNEHKEEVKIHNKQYREMHKDYFKMYNEHYRKTHKNQIKISRDINKNQIKKYRDTHFKENQAMQKVWRNTHRKQINKDRRNRRIVNIDFRIACNLRGRIWQALKCNVKSTSTIKLLGCSIEQLKQHLENQFKIDMSWKNYGCGYNGTGMQQWHVDHIIPCASFDLSKEEEQKKCFHYTNLQPLWAADNLRKMDSIT